jgi:hypothetical protein
LISEGAEAAGQELGDGYYLSSNTPPSTASLRNKKQVPRSRLPYKNAKAIANHLEHQLKKATLMGPYQIVLLTLAAVAALKVLVLLIASKGSFARFGLALKTYFRVLGDAALAERIRPLLQPPVEEAAKPARLSPEPLRLLALLQREGRLLDFLLEDIQAATDDQVGAGVRELHRQAQAVIKEHLILEPVLAKNEGDVVEVPANFDPSAIRLTGNVTGQPPFRGILRHHGWRVKNYTLPTPPEGQDPFVLAPAEVELP